MEALQSLSEEFSVLATLWTKDILDRLQKFTEDKQSKSSMQSFIPVGEIQGFISLARYVFLLEASLLEPTCPAKVFGDLAGDYDALLELLKLAGKDSSLIFLGNYVDRGNQGIQILIHLLAVKMMKVQSVALLRGAHESSITQVYGFKSECLQKYNQDVYDECCLLFECLPVAALVNGVILCVHSGISPRLHSINDLKDISRPASLSADTLLCDLLWSKPTNKGPNWYHNKTIGIGVAFGKEALQMTCDKLRIQRIVRSHQVVRKGVETYANGRFITVFSAPNYCGKFDNAAGIVCIDRNGIATMQQFSVPPARHNLKKAPKVAADDDPDLIKPFVEFEATGEIVSPLLGDLVPACNLQPFQSDVLSLNYILHRCIFPFEDANKLVRVSRVPLNGFVRNISFDTLLNHLKPHIRYTHGIIRWTVIGYGEDVRIPIQELKYKHSSHKMAKSLNLIFCIVCLAYSIVF